MGMQVGTIDKIEPSGDKMKVTFHYENKYKVPANASAMILNPTLVASRAIQLEPPYKGGPVLRDNAVIPLKSAPRCRSSGTSCATASPTSSPSSDRHRGQPTGPFGEVIEFVRQRPVRQGQAAQHHAGQLVAGAARP